MSVVFLDVEDVKQIHSEQIEAYSGSHGVRDEGALESAVSQAQAAFGGEYLHAFPFGMASAYAFHIAQNQPFVDGNKRAALAAALVFLELNEHEINAADDRLYDAMIAIAERRQTKADLERLFALQSSESTRSRS